MKPKTAKSFLKMCLDIAHTSRCELKGMDKLTEEEYKQLGDIRADIQNNLCDMEELLEKHSLEYKSYN